MRIFAAFYALTQKVFCIWAKSRYVSVEENDTSSRQHLKRVFGLGQAFSAPICPNFNYGRTASLDVEDGPMQPMVSKVLRFLKSEDGPTAVEYAVMLALIVIVCLTAIQTIGTNANTTFNSVATQLGS